MLKYSLVLLLFVGVSIAGKIDCKSKYSEKLHNDPNCKDENLKSVRAGFCNPEVNKYQVLVDYCYNTTKGQIEGLKVYLGDNKIYEEKNKWEELGFSKSIESDFMHFMQYFLLNNEMQTFMNGQEVPNFELNGIVDQLLIGKETNLDIETVWNTFSSKDDTIKIWRLLKSDIFEFSDGKKVEVSFRFSGKPYTLKNGGKQLQLFNKMPDKFPIPDSFFVTVLESGKKYEFVVLNDPAKLLYSAFKFDNCKKINWLKGVSEAEESKNLLRCK